MNTDSSHPVTRHIIGYKKEESDALLKFLFDHIALSQDLQTRVRWTPGTVVVWDVSSTFPMPKFPPFPIDFSSPNRPCFRHLLIL